MPDIKKSRILIMATDGFEQSELEVPRDKLRAAGATVEIASPEGAEIRGWDRTDWGRPVETDRKIADVKPDDYDALVLPGGALNPDKLRIDKEAMRVVNAFLDSGKLVAAICHAPWLLVQVDALRGHKATSWPSIRKDVENAGAEWMDSEVVVDDGIITSRKPEDLEAFTARIIEEVMQGRRYSRHHGEASAALH